MIRVVRADLKDVQSEGVLRSVFSDLTADTPFSREVELRAGSDVTVRLQGMGGLPVGAAAITPGGDLNAAFLIHVVVQSSEVSVTEEGLRNALLNGLRRAQEWGLESLALSPLGTGAGNLEAEESAGVMVPLIQDHLQGFEHPTEVIIVVASEYEEDVFLRAVDLAGRQASAREN